jgi:hypothetical protein
LVGPNELLPELDVRSSGPELKPVRIPVGWSTVSFGCRITILAVCAGDSPGGPGPVRLRVSEAIADCCRIEIFCGEAGLCGVSAGY